MPKREHAQAILEKAYQDILSALGDDPKRPGLVQTAQRAANSLLQFTQSYEQTLEEILSGSLYPTHSDQIVLVKDIEFHSLCEHHMLPFFGKCHIAYLPDQQLLGLSKISRIVHFHAKRLQIQENLTQDIAKTILQATSAKGVAIVMQAKHLCMSMCNTENQNASLTTSVSLGAFKNQPSLHQIFLQLMQTD